MWQAPLLNNIAAILGNGGGAANSYESIATQTVGAGGTSSITFSSIPSTYKHLQIRFLGKNNNNSAFYFRFNGVGGTSYTTHYLRGYGSSAGAGANTSDAYTRILPNAGTPTSAQTNIFAAGVIDVLDYLDTNKYRTIRALGGYDANGSGGIDFSSGVFMNTTAVSSITIGTLGTTIQELSTFALYGVKG